MKRIIFAFATALLLNYTAISEMETADTIAMSVFNLNEIVVSAKQWQQVKMNISIPITTLSMENILFANPQTAADLLGQTNKIFIQKSQQGGGSPMIRGFATNRLLYTVDGVRMNTAIFRGGNIQNVISLDPLSIEKTEVIFGAGPVLYGSDAIGGVMAFQTLQPMLSTNEEIFIKGNSAFRYSSANQENTGHFNVNIGGNNFASLTSFSYNKFADLRMGSDGPDEYLRHKYAIRINDSDRTITNPNPLVQTPTGYEQFYMMEKILYRINEQWDIFAGLHYSETSNYSRYDNLIRLRNDNLRDAEWYYGPQKWGMLNCGFSFNNEGGLLFDYIKTTFATQLFEESRNERSFNSNNFIARTEKVKAHSTNFNLYKIFDDKLNLYYGLEIVHNDVASSGETTNISNNSRTISASRYPQSTWNSFGAYLSSDYKLSDITTFEAGIRYNQYLLNADFDTTFYKFPFTKAEINKGALTGNFGLVLKPLQTWIFQINLSSAFRSPNVDDMGKVFESVAGYVTVPNPALKAEYAYNSNIGITKLFGKYAMINVNAYYTYLDNAMVRREWNFNGQDSIMYDGNLCKVLAVQNAANANVYGIDADIEIKFSAFTFSVFANYQKGEEELDDGSKSPLRHAPPFFGRLSFSFDNPKVRLSLFACYSAEVSNANLPNEEQTKTHIYAIDNDGNPYSPAWMTLNFKAEYKIDNNWFISAGLENILDVRYRPYSSGIVSAGRNFIVSLSHRF